MGAVHRLNRQSRPAQQTTSVSPNPQSEPAPVTSNVLQRVAVGPGGAGTTEIRALGHAYGNRALNRLLQRTQGTGPQGGELHPNLSSKIEQARSGGKPLDKNVGTQFSSAMNTNLGNVRVHTDSQADSFNQTLSSQAFTVGNDIFFSQGSYQPESTSGKQLLAHELTHVAQQSGSIQPKIQCLRIRYDKHNKRWQKVDGNANDDYETTEMSKYKLFMALDEMEKQDDGDELIKEILFEDPNLSNAWIEYRKLGSKLRQRVWELVKEENGAARGEEIFYAIKQVLSEGNNSNNLNIENNEWEGGNTSQISIIKLPSRKKKLGKDIWKGFGQKTFFTEEISENIKLDPKQKSKKTEDISFDFSQNKDLSTSFSKKEIWFRLGEIKQQAKMVRLKLQPSLSEVKFCHEKISKSKEELKTDTTLKEEIHQLKQFKSVELQEKNRQKINELENELLDNPNALSSFQKFRMSQIQKEKEKVETLELKLDSVLKEVSGDLNILLMNLFDLGKLAKDSSDSQELINAIGQAIGQLAGMFLYEHHSRVQPGIGDMLKKILNLIQELKLPIQVARNLTGGDDPEDTRYTAISPIMEAPQLLPDGDFFEPTLRQKEEKRRKKTQKKKNLDENTAWFQTRLDMILERIDEAYSHTMLQSLGYQGNVLSVFVGPEWIFGLKKICTPEQKNDIIQQLMIASFKYPHMLIVPGTILWTDNGGKTVRNTAPIIINGKLKHTYSKKSLGGDTNKEEMFERGNESNLFQLGNLHVAIDICMDHDKAQAKQEYYARNKTGQGVDLHIISAAGHSIQDSSVVSRPGGVVVVSDVEQASGAFSVEGEGSTHERRKTSPQEIISGNPGGRSKFSLGLMELDSDQPPLERWEDGGEYDPEIVSNLGPLERQSVSEKDDKKKKKLARQCLGYLQHLSETGEGDIEILSRMGKLLASSNYKDENIQKLGQYVADEIQRFIQAITFEKAIKKLNEKARLAKKKKGSLLFKDPSDLDPNVHQEMLTNILNYAELHISNNKKAPKDRLTQMKLQLKEIIEANQGSFGKVLRFVLYVRARLELVKPN